MSEYNKQTVAQLRQLLKDRSIPSTGLTRKAQIVEKLEEWDTKSAPERSVDEADIAEEEKAAAVNAPVTESHEKMEDTPTLAVGAELTEPVETELEVTAEKEGEEGVAQPSAAAEPPDGHPPDTDMTEGSSAPHLPSDTSPPPASEPQPTLPPTTTELARESSPEAITRTPPSAPDEKTSIEKEVLLPIPERSATVTEEGTRSNTEELETDTKKRKRRSVSPELPPQDLNQRTKRMKSSDGVPDVILKEDQEKGGVDMDTVMEQRAPDDVEKEVDVNAIENAANGDVKMEVETEAKPEAEVNTLVKDAKSPTLEAEDKPAAEKKDKTPRYKELFQSTSDTAVPAEEALQDDGPVSPALHPATPALYIRNFMRPLRPEALRTHLIQLATPPSSSPNPSILKSLFLDNMKTHALVLFANTTAASRVRASLHGSIWPPEGNRKDLWVDFVPDDKVEDWIKEEEEALIQDKEARLSGRTAKAKKFEIVYEETENGGIEAVFQEIGTATTSSFNPPTGPGLRRPSSHQHHVPPPISDSESTSAPAPSKSTLHNISASFRTLDDLFSSTTAKPKLYFLPVSDDRAAARLRSLDEETSRDWTPEEKRKGRGIQRGWADQKCRFGFDGEDGERVIEVGGDFGPWADDSRGGGGGRGWKGGFGGGRGRGGRLG